ncbi:MAG: V-type ATP synthase subunit K [Candidatus Omnitrophica bacterium]|nr:V-type ATP synthase subunit K [Candidatus Omnitrophota bacterium]MCF7877746.1 V-type ATP synthase subunit K [Candidatus Omnitrophota bacterium]MCF7877933.1 V-type ATP synthase subunit K [Candidatus Omnitrophota bacterium]MCF7892626.1 V-type ATP synthase subunit K [Candidatus Omnitrophota bacterium]
MIQGFGDMSLSLAFAAVGSALGTGVAGMAAVGAWKKAFSENKTAPFTLLAFVGAPLTQTIYAWILRDQIIGANLPATTATYVFQAVLGLAAGIAMGASAYMQGKAAARACDALAETGKGFGQYITVLGIIETVALFVMVFCMMALPSA